MAAILNTVQSAFVKVPHEVPAVQHTQKILLALSSAAPQMPDHRSGFFWGEAIHCYEQLIEAGWDVDVVSETGSATPDEMSLGAMAMPGDKKKHDDPAYPFNAKLAQIRAAANVDSAPYQAIYFAGGHACCVDLPTASGLKKLTREIYEKGGIVGADCHGLAIFSGLTLSNGESLLKGKEATGFSTSAEGPALEWMRQHGYKTMQEIVETAGGRWTEHSTNPMADYTRVSDRVVTGMNPASAATVGKEMVKLLDAQLPARERTAPKSSNPLDSVDLHKVAEKATAMGHTVGDKLSAAGAVVGEKVHSMTHKDETQK